MGHRLPSAGIPTELSEHFEFYRVIPMEQRARTARMRHESHCTLRPKFIILSQSMFEQRCGAVCECQCRPSHHVTSDCHILKHTESAAQGHHNERGVHFMHNERNAPCLHSDRQQRHAHAHSSNISCCHKRLKRSCDTDRYLCHNRHRESSQESHPPPCHIQYEKMPYYLRCQHLPNKPQHGRHQTSTSLCVRHSPGLHDVAEEEKIERRMSKLSKDIEKFDQAMKILEIKDMEVDMACLADPCRSRCCVKFYPKDAVCVPIMKRHTMTCRPFFGKKKTHFNKYGF